MVEQAAGGGGVDVDALEDKLEQGETLESLLARAIKGMRQLWTVVVIAIVVSLCAFITMGISLFVISNDNEIDNLHSCQRGNSRAADLVALTEKVQDIAGGPGASDAIDELAAFGRDQFVQRDCTGDGEVTDADRSASRVG